MIEPQTAAERQPRHLFEAVVADTDLGRQIHYRLRYDVYCLDAGFEDPTSFDERQERDADDERSAHFLVRCLSTGDWLAAARLIRRENRPLPVEAYCRIRPDLVGPLGLPDGEISRLLIIRKGGELGAVSQLSSDAALCSRTEIMRRLLIGVFTGAHEHGMRNVAFFLTPGLKRIVARLGIECIPIGDPCQHRGTRYPHLTNVDDALHALYEHGPAIVGLHEVLVPYRRFSELTLPLAPAMPFPVPAHSDGVDTAGS